jgi:hypothetical protein
MQLLKHIYNIVTHVHLRSRWRLFQKSTRVKMDIYLFIYSISKLYLSTVLVRNTDGERNNETNILCTLGGPRDIYRDYQIYWWRISEYPNKTTVSWKISSLTLVSSTPRIMQESNWHILVVIGSACICICKSNNHIITWIATSLLYIVQNYV